MLLIDNKTAPAVRHAPARVPTIGLALLLLALVAVLGLFDAQSAEAQLLDFQGDAYGGGGGPDELRAGFEAGALLASNMIGTTWVVTFNAYELTAGYQGMILFDDRVPGITRDYELHRIYVGINFLEMYEESMLRPVVGYAFGDHLATGEHFADIDLGIDLHLPVWMDSLGYPRVVVDVSWSFRPFEEIAEHFLVFARMAVYPIPDGNVVRPLGFVIGGLFGLSHNDEIIVAYAGLVYGSHY